MNDISHFNLISLITLVTGVVVGVSGVILNFLNKDRYSTQVDVYKPENEELRAINNRKSSEVATLATRNEVLEKENEGLNRQVKDLKELNSKQPDFAKLMTLMSNNHKEMMFKLTDLAGKK